jgi:YHS domain-containing protein
MNGIEDLEQRIKEKLTQHQANAREQQNHLAERMMAVDNRHREFTALADRLTDEVIRPRLAKLASFFENAEMRPNDQGRHTAVCVFKHCGRFPATTRLELGFNRDGQAENLILLYRLQILPVFFQFPNDDQKVLRFDAVDTEKVARWFEEKIVAFLDAYLRLETLDQYQADNLVTCPVCGMRINRLHAAAQQNHGNQTFYFCVENCRKAFADDPSRYLMSAHRDY